MKDTVCINNSLIYVKTNKNKDHFILCIKEDCPSLISVPIFLSLLTTFHSYINKCCFIFTHATIYYLKHHSPSCMIWKQWSLWENGLVSSQKMMSYTLIMILIVFMEVGLFCFVLLFHIKCFFLSACLYIFFLSMFLGSVNEREPPAIKKTKTGMSFDVGFVNLFTYCWRWLNCDLWNEYVVNCVVLMSREIE